MRNAITNPGTICPFYRWETADTIACEGVEQGCETRMCFADTPGKLRWRQRICDCYSFRRCPMASAAELKYFIEARV